MIKKTYEITVNAPAKKVRHTMLDDKTYRIWTLVFNSAGSWYEWDRSEDSQITFLWPNPENTKEIGGLFGIVEESKLYDHVYIHYEWEIANWDLIPNTNRAGAYEKYTFSEKDWITTIKVELDTVEEFASFMDEQWPKWLEKIKEIAEAK